MRPPSREQRPAGRRRRRRRRRGRLAGARPDRARRGSGCAASSAPPPARCSKRARPAGKARRSPATPTPSRSPSPRFNQARVAIRIAGSGSTPPRLLLNTLPPDFAVPSECAYRPVDRSSREARATLGVPGVGATEKAAARKARCSLVFASGHRAPSGRGRRERGPDPDSHPAGAGGQARGGSGRRRRPRRRRRRSPTRRSTPRGAPVAAVRQEFASGAAQTGLLAGVAGGPIGGLSAGPSGTGRRADRLPPGRSGPLRDRRRAGQLAAGFLQGQGAEGLGAARGRASCAGRRPKSAVGGLTYSVLVERPGRQEAACAARPLPPPRRCSAAACGGCRRWPPIGSAQQVLERGGEAARRRRSAPRCALKVSRTTAPGAVRLRDADSGLRAEVDRRSSFGDGTRRPRGLEASTTPTSAPVATRSPSAPATGSATGSPGASRRWSGEARRALGPRAALLGAVAALLAPASAGGRFRPDPARLQERRRAGRRGAGAGDLSADGRYLAFQGTIGGLRGVFRKDLETGAVAAGRGRERLRSEGPSADASAPSISADGRYVSFTTEDGARRRRRHSAGIAATSTSPTWAPRRRPTSWPPRCDGSSQGLAYEAPAARSPPAGSRSAPTGARSSSSPRAPSNLTSVPGGSTEGTPTPAGQVVLRDLDAQADDAGQRRARPRNRRDDRAAGHGGA